MLQLFENRAVNFLGKPAGVRSAVWSFIIHVGAVLFVLSLGYAPGVQSLPGDLRRAVFLVAPPPLSPPPPPPVMSAVIPSMRVAPVPAPQLTAPTVVPLDHPLTNVVIETPPAGGAIGGVPGGIPGGVATGGPQLEVPSVEPPPPPPPPVAPPKIAQPLRPERIQVSEGAQKAQLIEMIEPKYPILAKRGHIQGTVQLKAVIAADGFVREIELVKGHPMLAPAAIAAVSRWRYRPTLLNGEPVEVATDIIVRFRLEDL
jgi:protein TonB